MADHELEAERLHQQILSRKSFPQKWAMTWALRETAWALKASGLRSQHPDWPESRIQDEVRKIFLYGST